MASVQLRSVRKQFGAINIIDSLDLTIPQGSFTVLVGPSGCGKSTLLRMIAGLEKVTSGVITIGDEDVTDKEPVERGIAMVFQSYALYPHMSVASNIGFALRLAGLQKADIDRRVTNAARLLQLEHLLNRKPRDLSGGQRQRVAIGRAIVREPKVFLFDEPLSNLDASLRGQMRIELLELHRRLGTTIIYVTHDQVEAMTMADQIVVLNQGRIEQLGSPGEIYARPNTEFVAQFIGSPRMNILAGEHAQRFDAQKIGIRPEHLILEAGSGDFSGRVRHLENLGADVMAHVQLDDDAILTARIRANTDVTLGQQVALKIDKGHLHRFQDGSRVSGNAA